ncbi:MAG: hypothetical protein ABIY58_02715, partial [Acidimicrobiales bacterium]
ATHPSLFGHDVVAWNLYKVGDLNKAATESAAALRIGSREPSQRYHAAVIAAARGDRPAAVSHLQAVLDTNPRFSAVLAPDVERLAADLGLAVPPPPA